MRHAARAIIIKDNNLLVMQRDKFGNKYCALIGGGVDAGEVPEQALFREVEEETGVTIANPRLVIIEDAGDMYGIQHIYVCDYVSGEPALHPESVEAQITADGKNTYTPAWLPIDQLPTANLMPKELSEVLVGMLANGFPEQPLALKIPD